MSQIPDLLELHFDLPVSASFDFCKSHLQRAEAQKLYDTYVGFVSQDISKGMCLSKQGFITPLRRFQNLYLITLK
jgi:hypothetical protein